MWSRSGFVHATTPVWWSEDNCQELILPYTALGPRDQTFMAVIFFGS